MFTPKLLCRVLTRSTKEIKNFKSIFLTVSSKQFCLCHFALSLDVEKWVQKVMLHVTKRYSEQENIIQYVTWTLVIFFFSAKTVSRLDWCLQVYTQQSAVVKTVHEYRIYTNKRPNSELAPTSNKVTHVLIEFRFSDFKTTRTHVGICEISKYFTSKQVRWPPILRCCFNILLELKRAAREKMKKFYRRKFLLNKNVLLSPFAKSLIFFFFFLCIFLF